MNVLAAIIIFVVLAGTGALGILLDQLPETLYVVCTAKERALQSIFNTTYEIIDDREARKTLELLIHGQQVSQSSMDHLDIILKNKGYTIWDVACQVSGNNPPVEDPEDTDCETLTGADGTDGFSSGGTGWAKTCYEHECESWNGADGVPGLTSNDTGWAKSCYALRNDTDS